MGVRRLHVALMIGLLAFFAVFLVWPVGNIVKVGFAGKSGFTLDYIGLVFRDPVLVRGLVNASGVAISVTVLALAISLPLAVLSVRYEFPGKAILTGLLLVPLVLPPFVGGLGMRLVLGRFGPITQMLGGGATGIDWLGRLRYVGIVVVEALGLYPIMLVNIQAALANIDPAMEQAAANLGASRWEVFRRITLPMIRPGVFAGCTLVMIWSFTELGTPLIFNCYTLTPVQVFEQLSDVGQNNPLPYALVVVMLAASAGLYLVGKVVLGRGYAAATTKASVQATTTRLRGGRAALATLAFVCVIGAALLPHVSVVLTSLSATGAWYKSILPARFTLAHYSAALRDPLAMPSVANSIRYAAMATVLAVVVGLAGERSDRCALDDAAGGAGDCAGVWISLDQHLVSQSVSRGDGCTRMAGVDECAGVADGFAGGGVCGAAASLCGEISGGGAGADAGGSGIGRGESGGVEISRDAENHAAADRWELDRGSNAGFCVCDAGGFGFDYSRATGGLFSDHTGDFGIGAEVGGWAIYRERARRLGDGAAVADDAGGQCDSWEENRGDV
jgi:ABC-type spermidine/putrescine transport system permease subunit II